MAIILNSIQKKARNILIEVAKHTPDTHKPGLISYKEFWFKIGDSSWGRGLRTRIVDIIVTIAAFEIEHGRPPLNELVVAKRTGVPGEEWMSIKLHLKKEFGVTASYSSHVEAQQACWEYWIPKDRQRQTEEEIEEGYQHDRTIKFRTRNARLIAQCKKRDKYTCQACGFHMKVNGSFIIDCHHMIPLGQNDRRKVTKLVELVCLCPTCHRIAHTQKLPMSIKSIRSSLNINPVA